MGNQKGLKRGIRWNDTQQKDEVTMDVGEKRVMYDKLVAEGMKSSTALKAIENADAQLEQEQIKKAANKILHEKKPAIKQSPQPVIPKKEKEPGFLSRIKKELMGSGDSQREKEELKKAAKAAYKQEKSRQAIEYGKSRAKIETRTSLLKYKRRLLEQKSQQPAQRQEVHPVQPQAPTFTMPNIHASQLAGRSMFHFPAQPIQEQPRQERASKKKIHTIHTGRLDIFKPSKIFQ